MSLASISVEPPSYLSVVPSDRSLIERHSPGALPPSQELKYKLHSDYPTTPVSFVTYGTSVEPAKFSNTVCFNIGQGTGADERVGRTATIHLWGARILIGCNHLIKWKYGTAAPQYRVVLGIDQQPNTGSSTLNLNDVFQVPAAQSTEQWYSYPFSPVNEQRFTILYDKWGHLKQDNHAQMPDPAASPFSASYLSETLEFKTVLKLKTEFVDGGNAPVNARPFIFLMLPQTLSSVPVVAGETANCHFHVNQWFRFTD